MKRMNASLTATTAMVRACLIFIGVTCPGALFDEMLFADDWPQWRSVRRSN